MMLFSNRLNNNLFLGFLEVITENGKNGRSYRRSCYLSDWYYNAYQRPITHHARQHRKCERDRYCKHNIESLPAVHSVGRFYLVDELNQLSVTKNEALMPQLSIFVGGMVAK